MEQQPSLKQSNEQPWGEKALRGCSSLALGLSVGALAGALVYGLIFLLLKYATPRIWWRGEMGMAGLAATLVILLVIVSLAGLAGGLVLAVRIYKARTRTALTGGNGCPQA